MTKQVKGFLAADGTFFEYEPECKRYEVTKELEALCESHNINPDNFMSLLNAWHVQIRGYLDEDSNCQAPQAGSGLKFGEQGAFDDYDDDGDDIPAFLPTKEHNADPIGRDKDAKGFLEQQIRSHK